MNGQMSATLLLSLMKAIIAMAIIAILLFFFSYATATQVDMTSIESSVFMHQLLFSTLTFSENGYPGVGIVDVKKVSSLNALLPDSYHLAARVTGVNLTGDIQFHGHYNEEKYKVWSVLLGKRGAGGTVREEKTYYAIFREGESVYPGKITIDVVMPHG